MTGNLMLLLLLRQGGATKKMEKIKCVLLSWEDIKKEAKAASEKIKKTGFHPDIVIGLSRGGLVPARLFCDFLTVKNCYTIKVDHWGITAAKDGKARLSQGLCNDLVNKKVLVVDDITDTGQSMELAKKHVLSKKPIELKSATLIHLSNSSYRPDFYGIEKEWAWFIFPWNYLEDLVNLIKKIDNYNKLDYSEIKEKLFEYNSLNIPVEDIKEALNHISYLERLK